MYPIINVIILFTMIASKKLTKKQYKLFVTTIVLLVLSGYIFLMFLLLKNQKQIIFYKDLYNQENKRNTYLSDQLYNLSNSLPTITPTPTPPPENVKPEILGTKLTTPVISGINSKKIIQLQINSNWRYEEYQFPKYESGVWDYWITITNKHNPEYKYTIWRSDGAFRDCNFDNTSSDNNPHFYAVVESYKNFNASFGELRLGKIKNQDSYIICQNKVAALNDKTADWVDLTDIGYITVIKPKIYDPLVLDEMMSLIEKSAISYK